MEFLVEIHFGIPLGISLVFLGLYLHWVRNHLYPAFLEKQINKGKHWLYLPLKWNSRKKAIALAASQSFYLLSLVMVVLTCLFIPLELSFLLMISVSSAVIFLIAGKLAIRKRFHQQVNTYFSFMDAVTAEFEREGKRFSEQELHNLASYQFQNALRSADSNSRLLKELDERS